MTRTQLRWIVACASIVLTIGSQVSAQKITDERIQQLIRAAAERVGVTLADGSVSPASPTGTAASREGQARASVALSLDDAVKLTLERNLDIAVQRLNPQTFDFSIASLHAAYKPTVTSQMASQATTNPATTTIAGGAQAGSGVDITFDTYNGGLTQNLSRGGGGFAVLLNNSRQTTTNRTALFNPVYNANWSAQYTQPLLRGFKTDSTRQQLVVTKLNQDISESQLQATIINTLSNVRNTYWDYVFAIQSVDVAQRSVELAEQLVRDNQTRVEVGTMAPIDVVQAQAQAATQRQTLVLAESQVRTAELALKRLIVAGTQDSNWGAKLDPTDRPDFQPVPVDIEGAVRNALANRTDLVQAKKNLEANDVTLKFLRNQQLPQLDVVARYGLVGLGGSQLLTTGSGVNQTVIGKIPGGYIDSLGSLIGRNFPTWNVTLNFSYPLGTSTAEAAVARARIQLNQVDAQMRQIELQIATDVTTAAVNVQSNTQRVQTAQVARELAQRQLEAEQSKFEVGMSTNYFVVQSQRDLATAQNNELQAILAFRRSLVELDRLQQTTLQNLNITLLGTGGLNTTAVGSGRPTVVAGGAGG
jgi:outer membrane protein TolC